MPFWTFLIAGASLAGVPVVTAGFYSKDWILAEDWSAGAWGHWLWAAGLVGALLTSVYIFRVVFLVFFGEQKKVPTIERSCRIAVPLVVLAVLSIVGGLVEVPRTLGNLPAFSTFMHSVLPAGPEVGRVEGVLELGAAIAAFGGIALAWLLYLRHPRLVAALAAAPIARQLGRFWSGGWGFDLLYDRLLVRPYRCFARADEHDVFDEPSRGIALASRAMNRALARSQNGRARWYVMGLAAGTAIIVALVLFA